MRINYFLLVILLIPFFVVNAKWKNKSSSDEMGRGIIKTSTTKSTNKIRFGFPYSGAQRAELIIRDHPKSGINIIIGIQRGQFTCPSYDDCHVFVKFGNESPIKFPYSNSATHRSDLIFIDKENYFISKMQNVKKLKIEASFFSEGTKVLSFNVSNFKLLKTKKRVDRKSLINSMDAKIKALENITSFNHSHAGRSHSHLYTLEGYAHKHGNGALGKSSASVSGADVSLNHSHAGRSHSHPLPAQGIAHRHGNGALGKSSVSVSGADVDADVIRLIELWKQEHQ